MSDKHLSSSSLVRLLEYLAIISSTILLFAYTSVGNVFVVIYSNWFYSLAFTALMMVSIGLSMKAYGGILELCSQQNWLALKVLLTTLVAIAATAMMSFQIFAVFYGMWKRIYYGPRYLQWPEAAILAGIDLYVILWLVFTRFTPRMKLITSVSSIRKFPADVISISALAAVLLVLLLSSFSQWPIVVRQALGLNRRIDLAMCIVVAIAMCLAGYHLMRRGLSASGEIPPQATVPGEPPPPDLPPPDRGGVPIGGGPRKPSPLVAYANASDAVGDTRK